MPCQGCSGATPQSFVGYFSNSPCKTPGCVDGGCTPSDASCVVYTGAPLPCSGVETNDNLETILSKIDEKICQVGGDYSGYTFNCLSEWWGSAIMDEPTFVNAITGYACQIATAFNSFINITYTNYVAATEDRLDNLENPEITCVSAGVNDVDNLQLILTKYCSKFADIDALLDVSDIVFNNCLTVTSQPSTLGEALQLLADQVCAISGGNIALPTFDNMGTCLDTPSSDDGLVDTILKIRDRLCLTPTWDASPINWYCVTEPSNSTDLGEAMQNILTQIKVVSDASPTFSDDFVVSLVDPLNSCGGVNVSLAIPLNQDRFVAATAGDSSPGTLQTKLIQGTGVTLDFSTPTQVTISTSATSDDHLVLANSADDTPGFLDEKLNGSSQYGVSISPSYNGGTKQVDLLLSINPEALFDILLDQLVTDSALYAKFCQKVANCPSPCDAPTNVQAIPGISPTTSTTTLP